MKTTEIRRLFLEYFQNHGHKLVSSSPLTLDDPSLLFVNAGMVQFKNYFLGNQEPEALSVTSAQKCLRAGGKHNDLENVGYTSRHHTYFTMLGNFSFGSYFKEEAIKYAFDFVTNVLKLDINRLYITVHKEDHESLKIWQTTTSVPHEQIGICDDVDNFWQMGETGPCGPCTEIYYDKGDKFSGEIPKIGNDPGERYVEIWNIVFMEFNKNLDGKLTPLPNKCVDTGMGLERVAAVMQNVDSNYDTDEFVALKQSIGKQLGIDPSKHEVSCNVISDHIRSISLLISEGLLPSNEGRGYVLRRIMRRAIRYVVKITQEYEPRLYKVIEQSTAMDHVTEVYAQKAYISKVILREEEQFLLTLKSGLESLSKLTKSKSISGELAFKMYDTYGFPFELTKDFAIEHNLQLDEQEFLQCMQAQKDRSKSKQKFITNLSFDHKVVTDFVGYDILSNTTEISAVKVEGEHKYLVLKQNPFYAESGGQVADQGWIRDPNKSIEINNVQKQSDLYIVTTNKDNDLKLGSKVTCEVDPRIRHKTSCNHSATHLLHAALREILGTTVSQKGSLCNAEKLRFDFSYTSALSADEILAVEKIINDKIMGMYQTTIELLPFKEAIASGAMALFGEKYTDQVRVVNIANGYSIELCGGTHIKNTSELGLFKILSQSAVGAGIRRIEATTGISLYEYISNQQQAIEACQNITKQSITDLPSRIEELMLENKSLKQSVNDHEQKLAYMMAKKELANVIDLNKSKLLVTKVDVSNVNSLRAFIDRCVITEDLVVMAYIDNGSFILASNPKVTGLDGNKIISALKNSIQITGGGRKNFVQGKIDPCLDLNKLKNLVKELI